MRTSFYVIRIESYRLVAAQVSDWQAAESLDAGRPVLLASASELARLAQRQEKALVVFAFRPVARTGQFAPGGRPAAGPRARVRVG